MRASRVFLVLWLISSCSVLTSCALSPQQVALSPEINIAVRDYGSQRAIGVAVKDLRENPVLGSRGGVYRETSVIEIDDKFAVDLVHELAAALTRWGFVSHVNNVKQDIQFQVSIKEVAYTPDRTVAGKVKIVVALDVQVNKNLQKYTGSYSAAGEMGYITVPSEKKNTREINKVFNMALAEIFADKGLQKFLAE